MSNLYISWSEYHDLIETLATLIYKSGWQFNQIVCLAKGGLRIGDILSRLYKQPLAILSATSYYGNNNSQRGAIAFSSHLSMISSHLGNQVLLVDDLVDSGISLTESVNWLQQHHGQEITEIRTAVIWYKASSVFTPDYYVDYLPNNPWIHQPFERYEQISTDQLVKQINQAKEGINSVKINHGEE